VSDFPGHAKHILGNINTSSLTSIYFSQTAVDFRDSVEQAEPTPAPCRSCQYYWPERLSLDQRVHIRN
jgi:sulfatase maturation enzyme AslB (radical SAM superfamily)